MARKARKGVVPPQLRPYLFRKGGGRGGRPPTASRRRVTVRYRAAPHSAESKAKVIFYKIGGVTGVATVANIADKVHLGTRLKNIAAHTSSVGDFIDQVAGQAGDAYADVKANVVDIVEVPAVGWGAKKVANWLGFTVPRWWAGDY